MRGTRLWIVAAFVTGLVGSSASMPQAEAQNRNPSNSSASGVWRGWVVDGRGDNPNAGHMQIELTITGNRIVGRDLGKSNAQQGDLGAGTFTITGDTRTGQLDAVGTDGQAQGRTYLGVYQIEGDTLRWCVTPRRGARPEVYETGRGNFLMILRRVPVGG